MKHNANKSKSRRAFLQAICGAAIAVNWKSQELRASVAGDYDNLNSDAYLGKVKTLAVVPDEKVFTEGPAADRQGNVYFTNVPANKIWKWSSAEKKLSVFAGETHETNGLLLTPGGDLLCCEGGSRRVTRRDMKTGKITVLAEGYQGKPIAKPNDLCLDSHGRIYFTSRTAVDDPEGENPKGVYRIDPSGDVTRVLTYPEVHMPNGIVLSPDERTLYVIEAHPEADKHRDIRAYDVSRDGSLKSGRVLINFYPGRSGDGMCIDSKGNLYVAAGLHKTRKTSETLDTKPGIHVISPMGELLAYRETPVDTITNCTLGGKDGRSLYVTCGDQLLEIRTNIPG